MIDLDIGTIKGYDNIIKFLKENVLSLEKEKSILKENVLKVKNESLNLKTSQNNVFKKNKIGDGIIGCYLCGAITAYWA